MGPKLLAIEDAGASLRIQGNTWKKIDLTYNYTPNTVVEFDFQSGAQGEIHAIGLDTDNTLSNNDKFFQLFGTQTWAIYQNFHTYNTANGVQHFTIPIGQFLTGTYTRVVFVADDDARAAAESLFSNLRIFEQRLHVEVDGVQQSYLVASYSNEDLGPKLLAIEDAGASLRMQGNTWKKVNVAIDVTANTVLEFDFQSGRQGEIHAIGLDNDDVLSSIDKFFQLYGTQTWALYQDFRNYDSLNGWQHFSIPIGHYFTGNYSRLVFAVDDDLNAMAEGVFRNVSLRETL